jgi:hypothetical protein
MNENVEKKSQLSVEWKMKNVKNQGDLHRVFQLKITPVVVFKISSRRFHS